ncbi:MAG TPA: DUF5317 family protein [Acidimicrobiales bacterium]|nr:DUF5317 family protein [Acidimicrobiales bacterium]
MRFTLLAVATGVVAGLLTGGRFRNLSFRRLRLWPLLLGGVALQALALRAGGPSTALLLASYALLLAFAAANVIVVGMWLVATGIALNLAVVAVNGGMPVRPAALVAAGLAERGRPGEVVLSGKHHLERPSDRLVPIDDRIPVPLLGEVASAGDVVMAVGVADVVARLLAPPAGRRTRRPLEASAK